jgi:hypothetical protein
VVIHGGKCTREDGKEYTLRAANTKETMTAHILPAVLRSERESRAQWLMPIIPATREAETGGLWFKASPGVQNVRPYLKE